MGIIPEKRANICANWNVTGKKFVVGTSSGLLYVSTFVEQQNLWVAFPLCDRKIPHKATVNSVKFDPLAGRVVASGSMDGTVIITTNY